MIMLTAGGGGWGDPAKRDPAAVREDVQRGYITPEAARADYGLTVSEASPNGDRASGTGPSGEGARAPSPNGSASDQRERSTE
jgi:N-methylhydantoinase B/oxoprolinase/acetone carboxylase alpha subunit